VRKAAAHGVSGDGPTCGTHQATRRNLLPAGRKHGLDSVSVPRRGDRDPVNPGTSALPRVSAMSCGRSHRPGRRASRRPDLAAANIAAPGVTRTLRLRIVGREHGNRGASRGSRPIPGGQMHRADAPPFRFRLPLVSFDSARRILMGRASIVAMLPRPTPARRGT
jgi:hypothetical protein